MFEIDARQWSIEKHLTCVRGMIIISSRSGSLVRLGSKQIVSMQAKRDRSFVDLICVRLRLCSPSGKVGNHLLTLIGGKR